MVFMENYQKSRSPSMAVFLNGFKQMEEVKAVICTPQSLP
jgi:hypothetical protein